MYTGFELGLAVMLGLFLGGVLGLFFYFAAATDLRERTRAEVWAEWEVWAEQMKTKNKGLEQELRVITGASATLESRVRERVSSSVVGRYVKGGASEITERPEGGVTVSAKRLHIKGDWDSGKRIIENPNYQPQTIEHEETK